MKKQSDHKPKSFIRPSDKTELEDREAAGLWKAIALVNEIGKSNGEVGVEAILKIHKQILEEADPDVAGRFRLKGEDIKKLKCIEPPPGEAVYGQMLEFEKNFKTRMSLIPLHSDRKHKKHHKKWLDDVFELATWTQHTLVAIHPFCEGNGRLARLMTNLVLHRFSLPDTNVKIEGENKPSYLDALCQIDTNSDYRALKSLIIRGSIATFREEEKRRRGKR